MARITVEDCIDKFPSRFELVLIASNRARKLHSGEDSKLERDNDKNTVIALREIAQETLTIDELKNDLIEEYQTATFNEDEDLNEITDASEGIKPSDALLEENINLEKENSEDNLSETPDNVSTEASEVDVKENSSTNSESNL